MKRHIGVWSGAVAALGLGVLAVLGASIASAHSPSDPVYGWNTTSCNIAMGCPGTLRFSFDAGTRQIHDLSGLSNATYACTNGGLSVSGRGTFFTLAADVPVGSDGHFAFHGPSDARPDQTGGTLDIDGTLGADGVATGTLRTAGTITRQPTLPCPFEATETFAATGPALAANRAPVANADTIRFSKTGAAIAVHVLKNDVDPDQPDGLRLRVLRLVRGTHCGTLRLRGDLATFRSPAGGCPTRQRAVYVMTNGVRESNPASIFVLPSRAARTSPKPRKPRSVTIVFQTGHTDAGVFYPLPHATIIVSDISNNPIGKKVTDGTAHATFVLKASTKVHVVATAQIGTCPDDGLQIFYRGKHTATTPARGVIPTPLGLSEILRNECPAPPLP